MLQAAEANDKMKILQVCSKMVYGGLSLHVLTLATKLKARGHEVEIVSMCPGPLLHEFEAQRIPVHSIPLPGDRIGRNPLLAARAFAFVRGIIRDSGYDIVHTHGPSAHLFAGMAARTAGRPVLVSSVHGSFKQFASGHIADTRVFQRAIKEVQYGAIDALTGRLADQMVAVCDNTADEMVNSLKVRRAKITVVHNGIEEQKIDSKQAMGVRREFNCREDESLVVYVGRIAFHKGCSFFLEAMKQVVFEQPDVHIIMVGMGPLENELRRRALEGPLAGKVTMAGSRTDATAIMAAADLIVLPSLSEGLPLTLLEAAMLGKAMVATDIGGIPEIVRPGTTGLLVPPRNSESIARAVNELLRNDAERIRMGNNARKLWEENYTADIMADSMEGLYNGLLSARA